MPQGLCLNASRLTSRLTNTKTPRLTLSPLKTLVSSLMLQKIPEISKLNCLEIGIEEKKTRAGLRRKRNTRDEPMETLAIDDLTGKEVKVSTCGERLVQNRSIFQVLKSGLLR